MKTEQFDKQIKTLIDIDNSNIYYNWNNSIFY